MTFKEIQELIKIISKSDLAEFKMKDGEFELSIRTKYYGTKSIMPPMALPPAMMPMPSMVQQQELATAPSESAPQAAVKTETKQAEPAPKTEAGKKYLEIKSPIVGTFYRSPSPDKPAYVKVGDRVEQGAVVCIIEAMKLFNEIESDITGTIVKVAVEDAQPVEYDQVLFLVEP